VAAGAIAEKVLRERFGIEIVAWVESVHGLAIPEPDVTMLTRQVVDQSPVRCPDPDMAQRMADLIRRTRDEGNSLGGVVACVCRHVPAGWGEPVFDKISARLAAGMMSIPATRGFEIGSGFRSTRMTGMEHNDLFVRKGDRLGTVTNRSGGVQGGITNGEPLVFRVAFKPPATIGKTQATVNWTGAEVKLEAKGRHDPCVVPRAVPVVEAMAALVLVDAALMAVAAG
jgi:chorismate synthase